MNTRCLPALLLVLSGCHTAGPPARQPTAAQPRILFKDVASSSGLTYRWGHKSLKGLTILDTIGHGCAFVDYDGDGKLDILLVGSEGCHLYHNRGDGTFEEVTARAFAPLKPGGRLIGCAVADYDGDGRPDIFVTGYGRTVLYHNEFVGPHPSPPAPLPSPKSGRGETGAREEGLASVGDVTAGKEVARLPGRPFTRSPVRPFFRDVTAGSGLEARGPYDWSTSAAWSDYDGDGRLDLYVCRYVRFTPQAPQLCPQPGLNGERVMTTCAPTSYAAARGSLYHNEGGGRFRDVTVLSGLSAAHGRALGCVFADLSDTGRPDLYIANDQEPGDLFVNTGAGRFVSRGIEAGVAFNANGYVPSGMGVDAGDYDGDGRLDLLVADYSAQPKSLYRNEGGDRFTQASYVSGLGGATAGTLAFGACFLDADNDGLLDIALTNGHVESEIEKIDSGQTYAQPMQILRNTGGRYVDTTAAAGESLRRPIVGRGLAAGDFDGGGRVDLLAVNDEGAPVLLHNDSSAGNHWLTLRCMSGHGAAAIGARVTVTAGGRTWVRDLRAGNSYLSTSAPEVYFGLGAASRVESITVRWPDGNSSHFASVAADRAYIASEGATAITPTAPR